MAPRVPRYPNSTTAADNKEARWGAGAIDCSRKVLYSWTISNLVPILWRKPDVHYIAGRPDGISGLLLKYRCGSSGQTGQGLNQVCIRFNFRTVLNRVGPAPVSVPLWQLIEDNIRAFI